MEIKVNPGIRNGSRVATVQLNTQVTNAAATTTSYLNNTVGRHARSPLIRGSYLGGYRLPTSYQVFACKVTGRPFSYSYTLPTFPFNGVHKWATDSDRISGVGLPGGLENHGSLLIGSVREPDVSLNLVNQVTTEALANLSQKKVDILALLGESVKTVEQLGQTVSRLARALKCIARRDPFGAISNLFSTWEEAVAYFPQWAGWRRIPYSRKGIRQGVYIKFKAEVVMVPESFRRLRRLQPADLYLELKYGILPLIGDIHGLVSLATQQLRQPGSHLRGKRRVEQSYALPTAPSWARVWSAEGDCKVGVECEIYARLDDTYATKLDALGLNDFVSSAWELVPYSFVVDWMFPIGTCLQALTARSGMVFTAGYRNRKYQGNFTVTCCRDDDSRAPGNSFPTCTFEVVCQKREALTSMPFVRPFARTPFTSSHLTSAAMLVASLIGL